jgi:GTP-binding protein LepA
MTLLICWAANWKISFMRGKTGLGVENILAAVIERIPPQGNVDEPLQALIFDSHYNPFRGIEVIFRVINGEIKRPKD